MRSDVAFFVDRGMGSRIVPDGLRERGWVLTTMDERYGAKQSQVVIDVDWIWDATRRGEILLAKDRAIAKKPLEAQAIREAKSKVFVLASAQITGTQMLERLLANESAIERALARPGPFVYGVNVRSIHPIRLADSIAT